MFAGLAFHRREEPVGRARRRHGRSSFLKEVEESGTVRRSGKESQHLQDDETDAEPQKTGDHEHEGGENLHGDGLPGTWRSGYFLFSLSAAR